MAVPPAGLAAVSMPPTGLVESNGMPVIERVPPVVETGPTADTPGPAATSM
jgi:hypothetical protein